ncbi:S8 family serine peptidase [Clostridium tarantellae]|uniref:S8 family serine peptidase n=1 Tax=Clostridium tarantellae TaxID=39493 RepID=A0A6I1MJU2_9CLOT|nr:S8 family serine peptidase [Clostridium tarantellae]MPQ43796.1 S8 family serine peptidase [Clostridium tarantellae]
MIKKKLAQILVSVVSTTFLVSNFVPSTVIAVTENNKLGENVTAIKGEYLTKPEGRKLENKISKDINKDTDEFVSVIVEFKAPAIAEAINVNGRSSNLAKQSVDKEHDSFKKYIQKLNNEKNNSNINIGHEYETVFNGMQLTLKGSDVEKLVKSNVVKKVHNDDTVYVEQPEVKEAKTTEEISIENRMADSVPFLGVDKLHEEGVTGEGIKVGVIDTGIDYNHPDLANAYKGFKAADGDVTNQNPLEIKGWDFVNNDADPMETTYKDWMESGEPEFDSRGNAYYTAHGTHVSGTIAGTNSNVETDLKVKGVAPDVQLYGYRVLGARGSGRNSDVIAGIEKSVKDGMDVINLSLGNNSNDPFNPSATAVNNATLAGVVTVVANGNAGPGSKTVGSPATAQLPIAVGASTSPSTSSIFRLSLEDGVNVEGYQVIKDFNKNISETLDKEMEAVYCNLGEAKDFVGKDLTGKIALVDRGINTFVDKASNAKKAGAELVIIMNNTTANEIPNQGEVDGCNTIAVTQAQGEVIKEALGENTSININTSKLGENSLPGDEIAGFSSTGPVNITDEIRPDLVAPGVQIFSTVPEYINDKNVDVDNYGIAYGRMSGTSMATPHVAGVAALILQQNPDYTPEDVKAALMNTSEHLHKNDKNYSVNEQGAGRVNAYKAVYEDVSMKANYKVVAGENKEELDNVTGMISFGRLYKSEQVSEAKKSIPVEIDNDTNTNKTYEITVEYSNSDRSKNAEKNNVVLNVPNTLEVESNSKGNFDTEIVIPNTAEGGYYEGYIHLTDVGSGEDYQIPFSVNHMQRGFQDIIHPEDMYGTKGTGAFTTSKLFNRDETQFMRESDIKVAIIVNEEIETIHSLIKDPKTGEYIGYAGSEEGWWIKPETPCLIEWIATDGRVKKIKDEKVTQEEFLLGEGVYELEMVAITPEGNRFSHSTEIGIINDGKGTTMETTTFKPGIIEVTEDMYTVETWRDNKEYEGLWIKGSINNSLIDTMKKEYGHDYMSQGKLNFPFFKYKTFSNMIVPLEYIIDDEGNFMMAGIEKSDLENGPFVVEASAISPSGTAEASKPYIFINEGESYLKLDLNDVNLTEGESVTGKISLNNSEDVVEGQFKMKSLGAAKISLEDVVPSEELTKLLKKNGNDIEISYETVDGEYNREFIINFKIVAKENEVISLNGDIELFDVTYILDDFGGVEENLYSPGNLKLLKIFGDESDFKNSRGENANVAAKTIYDIVHTLNKNETLVYGKSPNVGRGVMIKDVYALDDKGNRYEVTYKSSSFGESSFTFNDLPVIEEEYKIVLERPGHLKNVVNVPGGKIINDNLVGEQISLESGGMLQRAMLPVAGDVNEDGVIDVLDAYEIGKVFGQEVSNIPERNLYPDLTNDGVVDENDLINVLENYTKQDLLRENVKEPKLEVNGKNIQDILDDILDGGIEDVFVESVSLNKDYVNLYTGGEEQLEALVLPENATNKNVFWSTSNNGVAVVEDGKVIATGEGEAIITVTTEDGSYRDTCKVRVVNKPEENVKVDKVKGFKAVDNTNNSIKLTWDFPVSGAPVAEYLIYVDGKEIATVNSNETLEYEVNKLNANTLYNFKIVAKGFDGQKGRPIAINARTTK